MTAVGSLYTAATGLQAFSKGMSVIGHNIANVSTNGYKRHVIHFADVFNDNVVTGGSGSAQLGKGVQLADLITDFRNGSFLSGTASTDLAIGGKGFFVVSPEDSSERFYTRSGAFRFDKDGFLKTPGGEILQGYAVTTQKDSVAAAGGPHPNPGEEGGGAAVNLTETIDFSTLTDIRLDMGEEGNFIAPAERTTHTAMMVTLSSQAPNHGAVPPSGVNSAFSMFETWNAQNDIPLGKNQYTHSSPIKIYDENGVPHTLTAYFDPVGQDMDVPGNSLWEYVLAINPKEDGRPNAQESSKAGLLMTGTMTFNAFGELVNQSAFTPQPESDLQELANWQSADISEGGYFMCSPQFAAQEGPQGAAIPGSAAGNMEINFGIQDLAPQTSNPKVAATDIPDTDPQEALRMLNMLNDIKRLSTASTNFDNGSATMNQNQNGYPQGSLERISVDRDGVMSGHYSNGQNRELFVLGLSYCKNPYDLKREGGNLFAETPGCGGMQMGLAHLGNTRFGVQGEALDGLGSIASESLEQSNVDMGTEFVDMIITEKGFQANSKVVTTTDEILKMLNQLKR